MELKKVVNGRISKELSEILVTIGTFLPDAYITGLRVKV